MPRKQSIGDLGYRMRRRLIAGIKSRNSSKRWNAAKALSLQATRLHQLAIYADFLTGKSVETICKGQEAWTREQVEEAIRTRGGTA